ncbi:MAG: SpoIIE family protein phosphatase [Acidobacteria bacterium]|nr:SpoIIE family protein phosphatase [Acidobacteriota bacterium]
MIRAVVVDDEAPARARLKALLAEAGGVTVVGEAENADEARLTIARLSPDVVFLDIEMPAERGTELAASLPEPRPFIVFATAYERFAMDAFQYDAADYLLKPVNRQRLQQTLDRLRVKHGVRRDAEREWTAAARAQAYLLPQSLPAVAGYTLAARTLPARAVGGDFYDATLVEGQLAFALGDVAGKGMAAGLIASSVQARWQAAMRQRDLTATEMMSALNRDVLASTEGSRYATLVHALVDPGSGTMRYVNAGHPAPLVIGATGTLVAALDVTAPAVGLLDAPEFPAASHVLQPGDTLVVVSDGVTEARDAGSIDWDLARIPALSARHAGDADALAAAIVAAVRDHRGPDQTQDDVTVFVLGRLA